MNHRQDLHQLIDQMPEELLVELKNYLQQLTQAQADDAKLALHLRQILEEDSNLLHRLAQ